MDDNRDTAHEHDMAALRREQLAADFGDDDESVPYEPLDLDDYEF